MTTSTYKLEFIMPCFCAGANPAIAELRPSAVRGQLRWWFRALGGSFEEESAVFGRIGDKKENLGSAVIVRTRIIGVPPAWEPPDFSPNDHESYVWYFAKVSGKSEEDKDDGHPGPRWESGAFAAGTKWELRIAFRRQLEDSLRVKFNEALRCFLSIGAIGLRATRGLGAFCCAEVPFDEAAIRPVLEKAGFALESKGGAADCFDAAQRIGSFVKGTRRIKGWKNDSKSNKETPSPLGTSQKPRQTSAIWFRPIRIGDGSANLKLYVFEAPHERVLGAISRKPVSVGQSPSQIVQAVNRSVRR